MADASTTTKGAGAGAGAVANSVMSASTSKIESSRQARLREALQRIEAFKDSPVALKNTPTGSKWFDHKTWVYKRVRDELDKAQFGKSDGIVMMTSLDNDNHWNEGTQEYDLEEMMRLHVEDHDHDGAVCVCEFSYADSQMSDSSESEDIIAVRRTQRLREAFELAEDLLFVSSSSSGDGCASPGTSISFPFAVLFKGAGYWRKGIDAHTELWEESDVRVSGIDEAIERDDAFAFYVLVLPLNVETN